MWALVAALRKDRDLHALVCPNELVSCSNGCGMQARRVDWQQTMHNAACPMAPVTCDLCHQSECDLHPLFLFITPSSSVMMPRVPRCAFVSLVLLFASRSRCTKDEAHCALPYGVSPVPHPMPPLWSVCCTWGALDNP